MANPQGRANTNKGVPSLGTRLSGSHLHSTRLTSSTRLIISRSREVYFFTPDPSRAPEGQRWEAHTAPLAIQVLFTNECSPHLVKYDPNGKQAPLRKQTSCRPQVHIIRFLPSQLFSTATCPSHHTIGLKISLVFTYLLIEGYGPLPFISQEIR